MATWQQVIVICDLADGGGFTYGRVRYPQQFKDQDVNGVIAHLGQQGFEITEITYDSIGA